MLTTRALRRGHSRWQQTQFLLNVMIAKNWYNKITYESNLQLTSQVNRGIKTLVVRFPFDTEFSPFRTDNRNWGHSKYCDDKVIFCNLDVFNIALNFWLSHCQYTRNKYISNTKVMKVQIDRFWNTTYGFHYTSTKISRKLLVSVSVLSTH